MTLAAQAVRTGNGVAVGNLSGLPLTGTKNVPTLPIHLASLVRTD